MAWIEAQRKAFTRWLNARLEEADKPLISDLVEDLKSGVVLCTLFEQLQDRCVSHCCCPCEFRFPQWSPRAVALCCTQVHSFPL